MVRICRSAALALAGLLVSCQNPLPPGAVVRKAEVLDTATELTHAVTPLNDVARYLAGMPGGRGSALTSLREDPHWQRHSRNMDELWRRFSVLRQPRIADFSRSELQSLRSPRTLWYPFSGPDILFAEAFFPGAQNILLCGLESPEMLPDPAALSPAEQRDGLDGLYTSLTTSLAYSFFITKDMRVDLQRTKFKGTLPLVCAFLARLGCDLDSVQPVSLDAGGNVVAGQESTACPGWVIRCRNSSGRSQAIYYFTENVADFSLRADPRYLKFAGSFGAPVTYLKSASYLMHTDEFSLIRQAILDRSIAVLQDDSGIPVSAFQNPRWDLVLYGNYTGVLDIFREYYQPGLKSLHDQGGPRVRSIDFGLGYKYESGQSALQFARKL